MNLKRIFYFGFIILSSMSFAMEEPLSQPEQENSKSGFIEQISYGSLGKINKIDTGYWDSGTKLSGIEHHFLEDDEFDKKLEPFKKILEKSVPLNRSSYPPPQDTLIIPIIERGAIVRLIEENKAVQLETANLYRCIGVAAWNTKRFGCLHYDESTFFPSLTKFIDDLTDHGCLNEETHFLLVTNYLTANLRKMYEFLLENVPGSEILIEAQHEFGGYVINEQSLDKTTQGRFYKASEAKRYLMEEKEKLRNNLNGRSISLKVDRAKSISYGFSASEMTENLESYFLAIDSLDTAMSLHSLEEVLQRRQLDISTQSLIFQTIVQKFYIHKKNQAGSLQELCYLYDSLIEDFK